MSDLSASRTKISRLNIAREGQGLTPGSRLVQKLLLALSDCASLVTAVFIGLLLNGLDAGHPTFDLVVGGLLVFVICNILGSAYANVALVSYLRSFASVTQGIFFGSFILLVFLFGSKLTGDVSRLSLSVGLIGGLALSIIVRGLLIAFNRRRTGLFAERLIILQDDVEVPSSANVAHFDVRQVDIKEVLNDPMALAQTSAITSGADRVIVACSRSRRQDWVQVLRSLDVQGELYDRNLTELGILGTAELEGVRTFIVTPHALSFRQRVIKRLFDIFVSLVGILLISPILLVTAIAIAIEDGRPILFKQKRIGRGNRTFSIFKFRSMYKSMSDFDAKVLTKRDDPRVTKVGKFIRSTSIDELPQLFNVLLGHMSLVGPRPHAELAAVQSRPYWEVAPRYWERHQIKPGITGLAQVRGFRGATDEDWQLTRRVEADLEYLADWSIFRDVKIVIATLGVVAHPSAF